MAAKQRGKGQAPNSLSKGVSPMTSDLPQAQLFEGSTTWSSQATDQAFDTWALQGHSKAKF